MRRYVLSAGRTGTVFLTHLLNDMDGISAVHEPSPTRWQMMLANLRNDFGIGGATLENWFNRTHQIDSGTIDAFVELNPFLCALADLIPEDGVESRIVHMVRHPLDWAVSMTAFKASTRYRHFIDFVPFSKPYPTPRPEGWIRLSDVEKALWRWRWCNERLLAISDRVTAFQTIRSEDILSPESQKSEAAARALFNCLELPGTLPKKFATSVAHRNPRPEGLVAVPEGAVEDICGALATRLGYDV